MSGKFGASMIFLLFFLYVAACDRQPTYPEPGRSGTDLVVDIDSLQENVPRFYTYRYAGCNINFFVIKVNGRILSFLDACTRCHAKKLGFRFSEGSVVCKACNERYPVTDIETGIGSCYPVRIEGKSEGGRYLLPVAELDKMSEKYFR